MKILHTSDWHVGRTIRGRSRIEEHEAVLAEIAHIAGEHSVDIVIVAGDLFDVAAPAPEAERVVYRALLDLARTKAAVVVVGGNHDSDRRLQAVRPLLELGEVTASGVVLPPDEGGIARITTAGGEVAEVALLPFLSHRYVVKADELMAGQADEHAGSYAERMARIVRGLCSGFSDGTVHLVAAHLMVAGGMLGGGERLAHTVFEYCCPPTIFPPSVHYVALGHLHRVQEVPSGTRAWYSGSPLALDFGESDDEKAVLLIDVGSSRPAEVEVVPLHSGRPLRTVRGTLADLSAIAAAGTGDAYLRVFVREKPRIGLADEVRSLMPEAVDVIVDNPSDTGAGVARPSRSGRPPAELFGEYLADRGESDPRLVELFGVLLEEEHAAHPA
jgi:exonuclease SbcD